jgi:hypothetical protein
MGNSQLKGNLTITLALQKIITGQPLEGMIIFKVDGDCPPAKITLMVMGMESGQFRE